MKKFDHALLTVCSSLLINLCVTIDDFVYSYCCTKLSMRYGRKSQGWTESAGAASLGQRREGNGSEGKNRAALVSLGRGARPEQGALHQGREGRRRTKQSEG